MKRRSTLETVVNAPAELVWKVVTDTVNTSWRSDIVRTEKVTEKHFIEYTAKGYKTEFHVTEFTPVKHYAFTTSNKQFIGEWSGAFTPLPDGNTKIAFTEILEIASPVIGLLSYVAMPLKKIQKTYLRDLNQRLNEIKIEKGLDFF